MFQKARIKLTVWYLLIIMLISIVFSLVIYSGINRELERFERLQVLRLRREQELMFLSPFPNDLHDLDAQAIAAVRMRLTLTLILINVGILGIAGLAGYFLAGRTLTPIKEMVDDQNRFITDASHELRTPLTSLKTSIEVNLRNKNLTLNQAKKLIESNLEDVGYLQALSDDLIHLAYYQKPNGKPAFEKILIKDVIAAAIDKTKAMAHKNKIKIKSEIENVEIKGDKKSLIELIVILLDNAIKYSGRNLSVRISAHKKNDQVAITVSDEGIGIADEDLPHIFDRFYRADLSRSKKNVSGYGLGLSIAKKIVEMHEGSITVKSEKNKGTAFTITL
ncbi:MAG: Histidine kinase protein [Candidatus Levybacteria bacterium]|nr:Histidine kinase protein [Candidatus Levybacteria bacterium]